jgi:hypothetical protein
MGHNNIEADMWPTYREKIQQFLLFIIKRQVLSSIIGATNDQLGNNFTTTLQIYDHNEIEMFHVVTPSPTSRSKFWDEDVNRPSARLQQQKMQLFLCQDNN